MSITKQVLDVSVDPRQAERRARCSALNKTTRDTAECGRLDNHQGDGTNLRSGDEMNPLDVMDRPAKRGLPHQAAGRVLRRTIP